MALAGRPTDEQLEEAAELRAKGASWAQTAREVNLPAKTVRSWPIVYAEQWNSCYSRAETDVVTEALGEAIAALRKQLRSEEPGDVRDAARQLLGFRVQLKKLMQHANGDGTNVLDAFFEGIAHDLGRTKKAEQHSAGDGGSCAG